MTHAQETMGLPSASGAHRAYHCPPSIDAEKGMPEIHSDDAQAGAERHEAAALIFDGRSGKACDKYDYDVFLAAQNASKMAINQFGPAIDPDIVSDLKIERRFWLREDGVKIGSAKCDLVRVDENKCAWIVEFKFGFKPVPPADQNIQLAAQVACVHAETGCMTAEVMVVAPNCFPKVTRAHYELEDVLEAVELTKGIFKGSSAEFLAGQHCEHCRAQHDCAAHKAWLEESQVPVISAASRHPSEWSPKQMSDFLNAREIYNKRVEEVRGAIKDRMSNGATVPGWRLSKPVSRWQQNTEAEAIYGSLSPLQRKDFWQGVKLSFPKLQATSSELAFTRYFKQEPGERKLLRDGEKPNG